MSGPRQSSSQLVGNSMGHSLPVNPVQAVAPIPDTSSQAVGLEGEADKSLETSTSSLRRVVEKTVDKLGRTRSLNSKSPSKRIFSLGRRGKEPGSLENTETPASPRSRDTPDDSPFVNPSSPPTAIRPSLSSFPLHGSMRLGTQTLIQALTAIPWTDDAENEEEPAIQDNDARLSEDEDDDKFDHRMASSIHAIHRPVARSQRRERAGKDKSRMAQEIFMSDTEEEERQYPTILSEEDDFDPPTIPTSSLTQLTSTPSSPASRRLHRRFSATGSMATIRVKRRAQLADKLRDIFELKGIQQVVAEIPCWLLRSVLLQGYLYLTDTYLCFFAHMPSREDQILKSGWMSKKAARTRRWVRHWFVLKNDVLSWYPSSSDPYFPHGVVDLRYTISCEIVDSKSFRLRTSQKTVRLCTDSTANRDEWIKAIRKVVFKAQNQGDSVKIAIPYSAVMDIEKSSALDFSETIEVKVVDKSENFSTVDSYFFAYFQEIEAALGQIRDAVRTYRSFSGDLVEAAVIDSTGAKTIAAFPPTSQVQDETPRPGFAVFRFSSLWRPWSETTTPNKPAVPALEVDTSDDFTHVSKRRSSFIPFTSSPERVTPALPRSKDSGDSLANDDSSEHPTPIATTSSDHTYPPSTSLDTSSSGSSLSSWGRPSWLRIPTRRPFSIQSGNATAVAEHPPANPVTSLNSGGIADALTSALSSAGSKLLPDLGFSVLDSPDGEVDHEVQDKFRQAFAFDENEKVLGYFPGHLLRMFPISGRLYVSENYFCFKSSGPLALRTKMILPIRDVLSTEKSKAFYFNGYGLVIIIRGYEELFFDFPTDERRGSFVKLLETQAERVRNHPTSEGAQQNQTKPDVLFLEDVDSRASLVDDSSDEDTGPGDEHGVASHMFQSTSSTFLTFKPSKPMHITCLTIGSRGDVQPYIALAKGLIADGHKVRIATHGEFKEWIESHGIEFGYVGGDPAELMRICVENGMFTVSFLKEGIMKFRSWIDDLLKTSWEACQGTDLLIESPSAMGGIHIADALEIPYFRAFTMTWTRTRAYPHAFGVPDRKMGGNYNYLSYVLFDQIFWRGIAGQVNKWRRTVLGLPSTSLDKMDPNKVPFLYNFSSILVPTPLDWPEWIRVTGYWFLDDADVSAKKWTPPPELLKFIETARAENKKIVYIGFGSIVVSDPKSMTKCVVDAVLKSGVYAILSKGWSDRLQVKSTGEVAEPEVPLPKEIFPISSVPHDWLFKRIDAACHHGGAGTTGASVRAGIPTIIKPFFGDQHFWADRAEALGIGSAVRKLTVQNLSDALVAATTDQKQIQRAARVGEQVRSENGVRNAIESIYRDMEYARSLTLKRRTGPTQNCKAGDNDAETEKSPPNIRRLSLSLPRGAERPSTRSSDDSAAGAASEDWSVISDPEDVVRRSVSDKKQPQGRRRSLTSVVLSALPDSLTLAHLSTSPPR